MNEDRDLNRLLDAWFADGPVQVADRVVDGAAEPDRAPAPAPRVAPPILEVPLDVHSAQARGDRRRAARRPRRRRRLHGRRFGAADPDRRPRADVHAPRRWRSATASLEPGTYRAAASPDNPLTWTVTVPAGWSGFDRTGPSSAPERPVTSGVAVAHRPPRSASPADSCVPRRDAPAAASVDDLIASSRRATTGSSRSRSTPPSAGTPGAASTSSCPPMLDLRSTLTTG